MLIPGGPAAADAHANGGAAPVIEPVGGGSGKGSLGKAQKTRAIGPGAGGHTPVRMRPVDKPRRHALSLLSMLRRTCRSVRNWQWPAAGVPSRGTDHVPILTMWLSVCLDVLWLGTGSGLIFFRGEGVSSCIWQGHGTMVVGQLD